MLETAVTIRDHIDEAVIDVVATGGWTWQMRVDLMAAVRKALAQQPRSVLLDFTGLTDAETAVTAIALLAEAQSAALHPPVPLIMAVHESQWPRLQSSGVTARIPVHPTRAAAMAQLAAGPPLLQLGRLQLQPTVLAPAEARNFVGDTCGAWSLTNLLHPARLVVSELATNVVEHARTPFTVTVSRRSPTLLHLAVVDGSPILPRLRTWSNRSTAPLAFRGNGLRIVAAKATAWGSNPATNGKVVWATLRDRQP